MTEYSNTESKEKNDKFHFNLIAEKYSKKDHFQVSSIPRKSILLTAMDPIKNKGKLDLLIDIGCGIGATANYLKEYYTKYIGVDQSEEMIKIARIFNSKLKNTSFVAQNIKNLNLKENSADLILLSGALHHMTDLNNVIKKMIKLLKNGGFILAIEPQSYNPLIQLMRFIRKKIDKNYSKEQRFFTEKELTDLFIQNGIKIKNINYLGYFSSPFAQIIFKPFFIFTPISKIASKLDIWLSKHLPKPLKKLSFNIAVYGEIEK